jgi:hypothetical protein
VPSSVAAVAKRQEIAGVVAAAVRTRNAVMNVELGRFGLSALGAAASITSQRDLTRGSPLRIDLDDR